MIRSTYSLSLEEATEIWVGAEFGQTLDAYQAELGDGLVEQLEHDAEAERAPRPRD
jgi:hypothetical protein